MPRRPRLRGVATPRSNSGTRKNARGGLARDPLAQQLRDEHLHGRLPRKPGDLHHRWGRDARSGSISRHTQHQFMWYVADTYGPKLPSKKPRALDWEGLPQDHLQRDLRHQGLFIIFTHALKTKSPRPVRRGATWNTPWTPTPWRHSIPHDNYDLVVANSVFEHIKKAKSRGIDSGRPRRRGASTATSRRTRPSGVGRGQALPHPQARRLRPRRSCSRSNGVPADYFRRTHARRPSVKTRASKLLKRRRTAATRPCSAT